MAQANADSADTDKCCLELPEAEPQARARYACSLCSRRHAVPASPEQMATMCLLRGREYILRLFYAVEHNAWKRIRLLPATRAVDDIIPLHELRVQTLRILGGIGLNGSCTVLLSQAEYRLLLARARADAAWLYPNRPVPPVRLAPVCLADADAEALRVYDLVVPPGAKGTLTIRSAGAVHEVVINTGLVMAPVAGDVVVEFSLERSDCPLAKRRKSDR